MSTNEREGAIPTLSVRRFLPPRDLAGVLKVQADCDLLDPYTQRDVMQHYTLHAPAAGRSFLKRMYVACEGGPEGRVVAWMAFTVGRQLISLDCVCVSPIFQGLGVASGMVSRLLNTPNAQMKRGGVFCGVRESELAAQKVLRQCGVPCVGYGHGNAFTSPDEPALVFLHLTDSSLCPAEVREKVLRLWSGNAPSANACG